MYSSLIYCVWILTLRDLGIESDDDFNILAWWCQYSGHFPILSKIIYDFLVISLSGVGVEQLFNSTYDICYYWWGRLYTEIIEALIMQMYTDKFAIADEYAELLDKIEGEKPLHLWDISKYSIRENKAMEYYSINNEDDRDKLSKDEDNKLPSPSRQQPHFQVVILWRLVYPFIILFLV